MLFMEDSFGHSQVIEEADGQLLWDGVKGQIRAVDGSKLRFVIGLRKAQKLPEPSYERITLYIRRLSL